MKRNHEYVGDSLFGELATEFCHVTWTDEYLPMILQLPPSQEERAAALSREPGPELEHALDSLADRWGSYEGKRNLLVADIHYRLTRRSTLAGKAFWKAEQDLRGRNFAHTSVFHSFRILSRLHLARLLTLRLGYPTHPDTLAPISTPDEPPMKRARLTRKVQGLLFEPGPFRPVEYPVGTVVLVIEALGPSHWIIETTHANDSLEGGVEYETLEVEAEALDFIGD